MPINDIELNYQLIINKNLNSSTKKVFETFDKLDNSFHEFLGYKQILDILKNKKYQFLFNNLSTPTFLCYEGQGAVLLEAAAGEDAGVYPVALEGSPLRFDWREMIRGIVRERDSGADVGLIAARFHNTLIEMAVRQCLAAREASGIDTAALSGGSFQNMLLMTRLPRRLEAEGFRVLRHRRVSCNDEGLSLGQLMIARAALGKS